MLSSTMISTRDIHKIQYTVLHGQFYGTMQDSILKMLTGLDDEPADEENEHCKEQQIENVAVVTGLRHRSHPRHCRLQETTALVKVIVQ